MHTTSRRHFLKNAAILSPVLTFLPSYLTAGTGSRLRTGFIGLGPWGQQYLANALQHRDIDVRAICDTDPAAIRQSLQLFNEAGYSRPEVYKDSYSDLLSRKDIDAIIIAAPWQQHYEIAKAAMLAGKHAACGAIMGSTLEEHKDIVRISEQTGRQYFTLEEDSYRADLQAAANMAKAGLFGELKAIRAGARPDVLPAAHNGEVSSYPVYPALAATRMLGVGKDNPVVSLEVIRQQQSLAINKPHPKTGDHRLVFTKAEISMVRLTTKKGQTLDLQMGAGKDQPMSTGFKVTGTEGAWVDTFNSIYLKNPLTCSQLWNAGKPYIQEYAQPAELQRYKRLNANSECAQALQEFINLVSQPNGELSVYAAATNSMIGPLAALSAQHNYTVNFPGFNNSTI